MKILVITNHSYMLYRFRREVIRQLLDAGCEVVLSTPFVGHEDDFSRMGVRCIETEVDRRGLNPAEDLRLFRTYRKLIRAERPELVVTYSIKPNIYGGLACRMEGVPYCANVQGLGTAFQKKTLAAFVTLLYRAAFRRVSAVFFENESNAALFREKAVCPREKQCVLPGAGINLDEYPAAPYPDNEKFHFLYLGRIMREKGVGELFSAAERMHERHGNAFVLDLAGFFEDEYREPVESLCRSGAAVFHGFQEDPRPLYISADCVVLPSYHEGMSNVLLEAAALGRPVITSDIPGCRESVSDGETGFLCPPKDADALFEAMDRMFSASSASRAEMGRAAHEKMVREFDRKTVVKRVTDTLLRSAK